MASGCWTDLLPKDGPTPAGTVQAMLNGGVAHTTTALAQVKSDPMTVSGASPELTFALTAGDAATGASAKTALGLPSASLDLVLSATSRSKLEVHLESSGCVAQSGTVHLATDANMVLSGDFQVTGMVFNGTDGCSVGGTLAGVPIDH